MGDTPVKPDLPAPRQYPPAGALPSGNALRWLVGPGLFKSRSAANLYLRIAVTAICFITGHAIFGLIIIGSVILGVILGLAPPSYGSNAGASAQPDLPATNPQYPAAEGMPPRPVPRRRTEQRPSLLKWILLLLLVMGVSAIADDSALNVMGLVVVGILILCGLARDIWRGGNGGDSAGSDLYNLWDFLGMIDRPVFPFGTLTASP